MNLRLSFFLFLIFLFSCAKPNYQEPQKIVVEQEKEQEPDNKQDPGTDPKPINETCSLFFSAEHLCLKFSWEKLPTETEMGSFLFKFYIQEKPNLFVDPRYSAKVVLWMPSMGHGSRPVTVEKTAEGQYKASKVFFIMPGQWEIRIQLKDEENVIDQVIKKITI